MTNRGAANSSLIRHGQNQATVEITLFNGGENAYKPEVNKLEEERCGKTMRDEDF